MKKADIKILIVEDDQTQGKALAEAFTRLGYDTKLTANPEDALNSIRQSDYKLAIVDCLLPKTNGIDLAQKLKAQGPEDLQIILLSGIYKDKVFAKEAQQQTQALGFFTKPLELDKLTQMAEMSFASLLDQELHPRLASLHEFEVTHQLRNEALSASLNIHGFELPLIYSLIMSSDLSGQLEILEADGETSKLSFYEGGLTQVFLKDKTSYFGVLLVEMGFTSTEEVDEVLSSQNSSSPLGERLVEAHSLSPHAIEIVRQEQMLIRLSKTVQDQFLDIRFIPSTGTESDLVLKKDRLQQILWDWCTSKISTNWFKDFFTQWHESPLIIKERSLIQRRLQQLTGIQLPIEKTVQTLVRGGTLFDIIEGSLIPEELLFPCLYFLCLEKLVTFGSRAPSKEDSEKALKRLRKILTDSAQKTHFEILGVSPRALDKEINKNYMELAKIYHPDRLRPDSTPEIRKLTEQYFAKITAAYDILKDAQKRSEYAREQKEGSAEKILQNESLFEQGQNLIKKSKYVEALKIFQDLAGQRQHRSDLFTYLAWALLKVGPQKQNEEQFFNSINELIMKVPPEDRHNAVYFYTKGLFYFHINDLTRAKSNLKHAITMDPNFVDCRRDLALVRSKMLNQTQSHDLSTVVKNFFGTKKTK